MCYVIIFMLNFLDVQPVSFPSRDKVAMFGLSRRQTLIRILLSYAEIFVGFARNVVPIGSCDRFHSIVHTAESI